jgi:hypothetical protein
MEGIPISELLRWSEKMQMIREGRPSPNPVTHGPPAQKEEPLTDEFDFLRDVEKDFAAQADDLLDSIKLSHLRVNLKSSKN